ncbi:LrgB-like family-domain-containing protein [Sphaerosporella brunnea]|uniref:LrgB-like family-domain-containing protein n=1 Tax=Sphaerosporella brunnea TaxID=1250544 RepID=A0A5J5EUS5_9PEZI|nr:LrgB-like family-domain-containing protein [Sphaerosporella brunnea]
MSLRSWFRVDKALSHDVNAAIGITLKKSWPRLVRAWIYVPFGTVLIMLVLWGIDSVIRLTGVSFPASVAAMLLLFFGLILLELLLGEKRTKGVVKVVEVPASFALKYINMFFVTSFVLLPLSPSIGAAEVGKIVAVFFIGFSVATVATVYLVRGLQLVLPTPKRADSDDRDDPRESIPLTLTPGPSQAAAPVDRSSTVSSTHFLVPPTPVLETQRLRGVGPVCIRLPKHITSLPNPRPPTPPSFGAPAPQVVGPSRQQKLAKIFTSHLDTFVYGSLFVASLPVLYTTGYTLPSHLTLTILSFFSALSIPPKFKFQRLAHPVLTCSALTILGVYILSLSTHTAFKSALQTYRTKTTYLTLFHGRSQPAPGAGDIFASLLDVSIVALALPMYSHRLTLSQNLLSILLPCIVLAIASLTLYPLLCNLVSIAPPRAISFSARSLTLALATPAVHNLGGDTQFLAVLCITSGIFGVLVGPRLLRALSVGEREYLVRGVALGANGSAVATAWLLGRGEVRAAGVSSLAMVALGVVVVVAASVGPVRRGVESLAGV